MTTRRRDVADLEADELRAVLADAAPVPARSRGKNRSTEPVILKQPGVGLLWVRVDSGDGYVASDEALLHTELATHHPTVSLYTDTDPPRPRSPRSLVQEYGRRIDGITYTMLDTAIGYDPDGRGGGRLVLPAARVDDRIVPRYDPEIDEWLDVLCGEQAERVRDWIATLTALSLPSAALYLQGAPSLGKSMLPDGLARLWLGARGPTSYADAVLGEYSAALRECPLVLLDEGAPLNSESVAFRRLLGNRSHALTEKYRSTATLEGCLRLIIAANDDDALRLREQLTVESESAIGIRILHVDCRREAGPWLASRGGNVHTGDWVTSWTGGPGRIAQHALWLRDHRAVRLGARFAVEGNAEEWLRRAHRRGGVGQDLLVGLARLLAGELDRVDDERGWTVIIRGGMVATNASVLHRRWRWLLDTDRRPPPIGAIGAALEVLAVERTRLVVGGQRPRVHVLDGRRVAEVAETMGIGDPDRLAERLASDGWA